MEAVNFTAVSLTVLSVFLLALFGSLAPLIFVTPACHARLLRFGNAFAAGFLSAASLVHLLPSALLALSKHLTTSYPVGGLLTLLGVCSVFVLDIVARRIETSRKFLPVHTHNGHLHVHSPAIALVLAVSLSFHSLVEGVSLGVSLLDATSFTALSIAILAHKLFAAIALGSALTVTADGDPALQKRCIYMCIFFASVTPVGAIAGIALLDLLSNSANSVLLPAVNLLSCGVFLYVAMVELLADQFRYVSLQDYSNLDPDDSLLCTAVFVASAGAMSLLALWT